MKLTNFGREKKSTEIQRHQYKKVNESNERPVITIDKECKMTRVH